MNRTKPPLPLRRASELPFSPPQPRDFWKSGYLVGRLIELSQTTGGLSWVTLLIKQAQDQGDQTVWITGMPSVFYPPDLVLNGVTLSRIVVVRVEGRRSILQASDWLARSGAWGLVVIDWGKLGGVSEAWLGRLARLAVEHELVIIFLTTKEPHEASIGSQVSLRVHARMLPNANLELIKDKAHSPSRIIGRSFRGPPGLS